jgi:D-amino peptidase
MNIYVMVDMEGISGIMDPRQVSSAEGKYYESEGRRLMTLDANACVDGCFRGGAEKVIVRDAHGGAKNFFWDQLDPRAEYVMGSVGDIRMPGIEECDGLILLGYHAMAGTEKGILEHTFSSKAWQNLWINGEAAGEVALDAGIAGDYGKPVIMVSGDDWVCSEAKQILPDVVTAEVKKGITMKGARLLSMKRAHALITEKTAEAVQKCGSMAPYSVKKPVTLRLERIERGGVPSQIRKPYVTVLDGRTFEVSCGSVEEALVKITG